VYSSDVFLGWFASESTLGCVPLHVCTDYLVSILWFVTVSVGSTDSAELGCIGPVGSPDLVDTNRVSVVSNRVGVIV